MVSHFRRMGRECVLMFFLLTFLISLAQAADPPSQSAAGTSQQRPTKADAEEVSRKLSDPLSSLWSLATDLNFQYYSGDIKDKQLQVLWDFKPAMPIGLADDWMWVNRPVFPVYFKQPYLDMHTGQWEKTSGLGDIQYLGILGKHLPSGWVLAGGPTLIFPTASHDETGQGKWQAGPAAVAAYLQKGYILGALAQHWWSFAGQDDRNSTSTTALQVFYYLNLPGGWQVGGSPVITADWMKDQDNRFNVPLGLGVYKTLFLGRLPIKVGLEFQYSVVDEDLYGRDYNIKFVVTPVIFRLF